MADETMFARLELSVARQILGAGVELNPDSAAFRIIKLDGEVHIDITAIVRALLAELRTVDSALITEAAAPIVGKVAGVLVQPLTPKQRQMRRRAVYRRHRKLIDAILAEAGGSGG